MSSNRSQNLYKQNYVDKDFERLELFVLLKERYFVPKADVEITPEYLYKIGRGVGYTRTAWAYMFQLG
jgi:hypothetical protein